MTLLGLKMQNVAAFQLFFFLPAAERPQARERREAQAREVCGSCSVVATCREFARSNREYGFGAENLKKNAMRPASGSLHQLVCVLAIFPKPSHLSKNHRGPTVAAFFF